MVVKRGLNCIKGIIVEITLKMVGLTALYIWCLWGVFQRVSKPQDWVAPAIRKSIAKVVFIVRPKFLVLPVFKLVIYQNVLHHYKLKHGLATKGFSNL